jgi:hypothetical protein
VCQCVVRTVIMYFLYQGLHALVLVSEYGEYRIRFLVVVWSACLMVGPVGDLVSLHSGPLVCRSESTLAKCTLVHLNKIQVYFYVDPRTLGRVHLIRHYFTRFDNPLHEFTSSYKV